MANLVTVLYQKNGVNFKTSVFNIALSGNYAAPEVVTLTSAASNPGAQAITGPSGASPLSPVICGGGIPGYVATLAPTATPGQYNLSFANGAAPFAGAYPANSFITVEVDHDLQGF